MLFDVSPCVYNAPLAFFLYNASSNTLSPVPNVPNAANDSTYYTRMLALPNGQVLFNDGSNQMLVYTAGGTPNPAWAPSITSISSTTLTPGQTASLSGTQLAGLSQGAAYGDDVQDNTNFPLVRITNSQSGVVTYARTSNWTLRLDRARRRFVDRFHRPDHDAGRSQHPRRGRQRDRLSAGAGDDPLRAPASQRSKKRAMDVPTPVFRGGHVYELRVTRPFLEWRRR